ncbi:hypothetical protein [Staphylococcus gallinarum]|uniref:UDP-N-acetylglucosamine 1-carboxyvinyltransferase n=1 Tax=Staphylococcus gallinarum TaxID=1293 RepID=A0A0D0QU67_STAGA|nr:hypothetical protein [Staphylococcus gallinarum]KIR10616.1 hypothetical protein SH09_12050 [Staphylococcus gallinarum]GEQ06560.1 UDP-N-acetylglucosamine 1-carboxyvinyltransferase [Staphylococcus gallinarum]SUQ38633.1 UDP-N-acetylglucosamine 1-carboxyvinyltransferase [Staphylococcus gallinarum]
MNNYIDIQNGNLRAGTIDIKGYKHSAVTLICASLALQKKVVLNNVPNIKDTEVLKNIIRYLGGDVSYYSNKFIIDCRNLKKYKIPQELNELIHGSIYLLPVVLGVMNKIEIGKSGGCKIGEVKDKGERPILHMIQVLETMGAKFYLKNDTVYGEWEKFSNTSINIMDFSDDSSELSGSLCSGATKTALLGAIFCEENQIVEIQNPYLKPDVTELIELLKICGFNIFYDSSIIRISRQRDLVEAPEHHLISDISEIVTYISLSIYTDTPITLKNVTTDRVKTALKPELLYLKKMGINLIWENSTLHIPLNKCIQPVDINVTCMGIYSDSHPFFTLMLTKANGVSTIRENVWKNRFSYVDELTKLGLELNVQDNTVYIHKSDVTTNENLYPKDLRSTAVILIAALKSPQKSRLFNVEQLHRGYEDLIGNLLMLNARITNL